MSPSRNARDYALLAVSRDRQTYRNLNDELGNNGGGVVGANAPSRIVYGESVIVKKVADKALAKSGWLLWETVERDGGSLSGGDVEVESAEDALVNLEIVSDVEELVEDETLKGEMVAEMG